MTRMAAGPTRVFRPWEISLSTWVTTVSTSSILWRSGRHSHSLLEVDQEIPERQVRVEVCIRKGGGDVNGPITVGQGQEELVERLDTVGGQLVDVPEDVERRPVGRLEGGFSVVVEVWGDVDGVDEQTSTARVDPGGRSPRAVRTCPTPSLP